MDEIDEILKDMKDINESGTQTEQPIQEAEVEPVESEEKVEQTSPENDSETEVLSDEPKETEEKKFNTTPVYEEDNSDYIMSKETKDLYLQFGTRYLNLMQERKRIGEDVKALKQEFAEQGISVNTSVKVLNLINSEQKRSAVELDEIKKLRELFKSEKNIMDQISDLSAKS